MKPVKAIVLLSILFLPFVFLYQGWSVKMYQHRKAVKAQLLADTPNEALVTLAFTPIQAKQLNWAHEREFQHNGEWYDIVRTDTLGNTLVYHCWWDHEETQLYQQLNLLIARQYGTHTPETPQEQQCQQLLRHLFIGDLPVFSHPTLCLPIIGEDISQTHTAAFLQPATPPPQG